MGFDVKFEENDRKYFTYIFIVMNWISFISMVVLNTCYGAGFYFPISIGDVSNAYPVLFDFSFFLKFDFKCKI